LNPCIHPQNTLGRYRHPLAEVFNPAKLAIDWDDTIVLHNISAASSNAVNAFIMVMVREELGRTEDLGSIKCEHNTEFLARHPESF
jgi:hypothetical protein